MKIQHLSFSVIRTIHTADNREFVVLELITPFNEIQYDNYFGDSGSFECGDFSIVSKSNRDETIFYQNSGQLVIGVDSSYPFIISSMYYENFILMIKLFNLKFSQDNTEGHCDSGFVIE